ncbi:MAG: helix-turn-helix transcriptional regulator [Kiritimatiellae bacterium]|nr:helix-turn-helix transcriptional regulator [Kiritimatiellia bacterium]
MIRIEKSLLNIEEPRDYWAGIGDHTSLPIPTNALFFLRQTAQTLQQEALQNRSHHRFVLMFNMQAAGTVHVDHLLLPLQPGQALLVLPYQFHHFSHLASEQIEWLFCAFEMEEGTFLEPFRNRVVSPRRGSMQALNLLLTEWRRCRDSAGRGQMQEMQLQIVLLYLLISLRDDLQEQAFDLPPEPKGKLLRSVNRLMSEWRGRQVTTTDLAAELGLSASRLRAVFKETAGVSLGRYILNYRLNRAMALLRTSDLPIAEIAEEAGFGSPQAFSRIFKQKIGQTPRTYRRQPDSSPV